MHPSDNTSIFSLTLFFSAAAFSPGPAAIVFLASGATIGFRRSAGLVIASTAGLSFVFAACLFGVAMVSGKSATFDTLLLTLALSYILFVVFKMWNGSSERPDAPATNQLDVLLLQTSNPKAWAFMLAFFSAFVPTNPGGLDYITTFIIFVITGALSMMLYSLIGAILQQKLESLFGLEALGKACACCLLASTVLLFW